MFARVSTIKGKPDKVDVGIRDFREKILPTVQGLAGFKGAYLLADRKSGKIVVIALWETEAALKASSAVTSRLRGQATETADATEPPIVEIYEVAVKP